MTPFKSDKQAKNRLMKSTSQGMKQKDFQGPEHPQTFCWIHPHEVEGLLDTCKFTKIRLASQTESQFKKEDI